MRSCSLAACRPTSCCRRWTPIGWPTSAVRPTRSAWPNRLLRATPAHPVVYWAGAVRNTGERIVGAVLLGESLTEVAAGIPGSTFYDLSGVQLASTLHAAPVASESLRRQLTADNAVRVKQMLAGHW